MAGNLQSLTTTNDTSNPSYGVSAGLYAWENATGAREPGLDILQRLPPRRSFCCHRPYYPFPHLSSCLPGSAEEDCINSDCDSSCCEVTKHVYPHVSAHVHLPILLVSYSNTRPHPRCLSSLLSRHTSTRVFLRVYLPAPPPFLRVNSLRMWKRRAPMVMCDFCSSTHLSICATFHIREDEIFGRMSLTCLS